MPARRFSGLYNRPWEALEASVPRPQSPQQVTAIEIELRPVMVVRSAVSPAVGERFRRWYTSVHIRDVLTIPGVDGYATVRGLPAHRMVTLYQFSDESVVQAALNSPQAHYARGTWEQWRQHLQELSVEIYAPLAASVALRHWN
jgi:hypothetical protein